MTVVHSIAADGTVRVPSFDLPFSSLASDEAGEAYSRQYTKASQARAAAADGGPPDIATMRKQVDDEVVLPLLEKQHARWPGKIEIEPIDVRGVHAEVISPKDGVADGNRDRVLINVHGGGFMAGARTQGRLESIPIAALGRVKVVSVDYRLAPEHRFPAASEDLAVVYESLLNDYEPENVGIYGGSSGGILTAQSIPWFLEHDLPLPGALGMLGGTGQSLRKGDSATLAFHAYDAAGVPPEAEFDVLPYFTGTDFAGRLASPMLWPEVLAQFPPSLLVTGSRGFDMSAIVDAHNKLVLAGAPSHLHVWDGLGHCFYTDADLPESREVEKVVVEFFAGQLGRSRVLTEKERSE